VQQLKTDPSASPQVPPGAGNPPERYSALRFLIISIAGIGLAEVVAMIVVYFLQGLPYPVLTLIDAGVMLVLIYPLIYFLSFKPLLRNMEQRRQTEQALRQSEQLFATAFHASPAALIITRANDGMILDMNESFSRLSGYERGEVLGNTSIALDMYPPEERDQVLQIMEQQGHVRDFEIHGKLKSGTIRNLVVSVEMIQRGGVPCLLSTLFDITERKQTEEQLRQLSRVVEQAEDTVVITDRNGKIVYVNPAFERLTGYRAAEAVGNSPRVIKSGLHDNDFYKNLWDTILMGEVFTGEIANRKKSGDVFYEIKTIAPLRDARGVITHFVATGKDITEKKYAEEQLRLAYQDLERRVHERTAELQKVNTELDDEVRVRRDAEVALRQSQQHLNLAQEIAHLGSWQLDLVTNQLTWSDEVYRIFGMSPQQFGATYEAFLQSVHPDDRAAVDYAYRSSILEGRDHYEIEHRVVRQPTGEVRIVHEKCEHFRDQDGRVIRSLGMVHDITARKQAEDALRAAHNDLELRVQERTRQLENLTRLEHAQRQFSDALVGAALGINKSMRLEEVLRMILEQVEQVIPYGHANIMLLDGDAVYVASHRGDYGGPEKAHGIGARLDIEGIAVLQEMRTSCAPVLLPEACQNAQWAGLRSMDWVCSSLSAPLLIEQRVIGFVNLYSAEVGFFTEEMRSRLSAFAAHAAVAIQNAWLFEQAQAGNERLQFLSRRLVEVQENERHYISRELHDEAGQALTSLLLDLDLLERDAANPQMVLKRAAEMEDSLREVLENLHRLAMALRPASLDHLGLVAALKQHVEAVGAKNHLKTRFEAAAGIKRLPENVETVIYRIVQEALTNVVRHSQATQVEVILTLRAGVLVVIVEDNGIGFNPDSVISSDHMGLFGMLERAQMIGAKLLVESAPGKGTVIMMEVGYVDTAGGR
jgi:PAS domain S-box-containing protein